MENDNKYVLRYEWEKSKRDIYERINNVDNKHIERSNNIESLVLRLDDRNKTLIENQKDTNTTLKDINQNLKGFNERIIDVEYKTERSTQRLNTLESNVSERQKGNIQIWVAVIGAISVVVGAAFTFATALF